MDFINTRDKGSVAAAVIFVVCIFLAFAPNARVFFKYIKHFSLPLLIAYGAILTALSWGLAYRKLNKRILSVVGQVWFVPLVLLVLAVIVWYMYPIADGLKLQMRGSDQDDCVIIGASRMARLLPPYAERSYFNNPCSPGVGMLLMYLPFVLLKIYPLGAIVAIGAAAAMLKKYTKDRYSAGAFVVFFAVSVFSMEILVVGSDLVMLGCGLVILALGVVRAVQRRSVGLMVANAIFCGVLASTRVNFLVVLPLFSFLIFMQWRLGAILLFLIGAVVAIIPSLFIYLNDPAGFTPLHLIGKSQNLLPAFVLVATAILSLVLTFYSAFATRRSIEFLPTGVLISLLPSLLSVSAGDLFSRGWAAANWEGANYLIPLLPLSFALMAMTRNHLPLRGGVFDAGVGGGNMVSVA